MKNSEHTLLTAHVLEELGFADIGECTFDLFTGMSYWAKNGICLFYNTPISKDRQDPFYVGYGELRQGRYVAVAFRWIDSVEELTQIYEAIKQEPIKRPIP